MNEESINISLPKGDALKPLAAFFQRAGLPVSGYASENRTYRAEVTGLRARVKIMAEKDVAVQVAVNNYDMGFCGLDWIMEHAVRYKGTRLSVFRRLDIAGKKVLACSARGSGLNSIADLKEKRGYVTLVSEYPNLAKAFAVRNRLKKFKVFSAWGSAEAYPPEHADVALIAAADQSVAEGFGLRVLSCEVDSDICMVVNKKSFACKNLSPFLKFFHPKGQEASNV